MNESSEYIYYFTIMKYISGILLHSSHVCQGYSIIFYYVENIMLIRVSVSNAFGVLAMLLKTMLIVDFL